MIVTFAGQVGRCIPCLSAPPCCGGPFGTARSWNSLSSGEEGGKQTGCHFSAASLWHFSQALDACIAPSAQVSGPVCYLITCLPTLQPLKSTPALSPRDDMGPQAPQALTGEASSYLRNQRSFLNPTQLLIPPAPDWDNISLLSPFTSSGC